MECFIYARKSTESEDRQVLSIEAQIKELQAVALNQGLKIVEVFTEAKSAKAPGRPTFNKVLDRLYQNQDMGILCWKLDRLARNPVDGGQLIWSIEQGRIKQIITPSRRFLNNGDDKFWMQLEFGMAKKYIDDLSDNVKRGLRVKLEKGVWPNRPPIGYLNDRDSRLIVKDSARFPLIRRIWDAVLREDYCMEHLLRVAEDDWGLLTRQSKKRGGRPLSKSVLYSLLSNPFYYGAILCKGQIYSGCHEPMVTKDEFDQVQRILGRAAAKPQKKEFIYTGLIRCGECGSMVTAEEQVNRYGYHYTYYHCTKNKGGIHNHCGQKYVRAKDLEDQIAVYLESISLPESFVTWGIAQLKLAQTEEEKLQEDIHRSLKSAVDDCKKRLDNLLQLKLRDLLTDQEFIDQKSELTVKKMQLEGRLVPPQFELDGPAVRLFLA
jgi:site-specific DNA recombinase